MAQNVSVTSFVSFDGGGDGKESSLNEVKTMLEPTTPKLLNMNSPTSLADFFPAFQKRMSYYNQMYLFRKTFIMILTLNEECG